MLLSAILQLSVVAYVLIIPLKTATLQPPYLSNECWDYSVRHFYRSCGACGLCQELKYAESEQTFLRCIYGFIGNVFINETKNKCKIMDVCKKSIDKHECQPLPCVPMLGTFKCQCDATKIGRLCQYNVGLGMTANSYATLQNLLYNPYFIMNEYITISLMFSSLGKKLKIVIKTLTERLIYNEQTCHKMDLSHYTDYCISHYTHYKQFCTDSLFHYNNAIYVFTAKIPFPGRGFKSKERKLARAGNGTDYYHFLGMIEPLQVEIYNGDDNNPTFETAFSSVDIASSPDFSICETEVTIIEGGQTLYNIIKVTRGEEITIDTLYRMNHWESYCINSIADLNIKWALWIFDVNHSELDQNVFMEKYTVEYITFKPYSVQPAQYKVRSNVTLWYEAKEGFSAAYSYFEVVLVELEPIIQGGHSRSLYFKNDKIVINGSQSRNPNLSLLDQVGDLRYYWKCDKDKTSSGKYSSESHITYYGPFKVNEVYTFELTVISRLYNIHKTAVQKITMAQDVIPTLEINCRKNCGGSEFKSNPLESTYFEVSIIDIPPSVKSNDIFSWAFKTDKEQDFKSVENIKLPHTPDNVLIILANALLEGETYYFQGKGGSSPPGEAIFQLKMATPIKKFSCVVNSNQVWQGEFIYIITCDRLLFNNLSPTYGFYDRFPRSNSKGRLLGFKRTNILKDVAFTRGNLVVEVTNLFGIVATVEIDVKVQPQKNPVNHVKELVDDLEFYHTTMDPGYKANVISAVMDIVYSKIEKFPTASDIIERFLVIISEEEIHSFPSIELLTLAIEVLINDGGLIEWKPSSLVHLSQIAVKLTDGLNSYFTVSSNVFHDFTSAETFQLAQSIINICSKIFSSKSEDLEHDLYYNYIESSKNNLLAIETLICSLKKRILPFIAPFKVKGEHIRLWIKEDKPMFFYELSVNQTLNESIPSVIIPRSLVNQLSQLSNTVTVQVVVFDGNPYWWYKKVVISTNVVDLKLSRKVGEGEEYVTELHYPVQITLNYRELETTTINGIVMQPNVTASLETADLDVAIHKVRAEERGRLKVTFLGLQEGEVFKVLALFNLRPYYEIMMEMGQDVDKSSPEYVTELLDPTSQDVYDLYYMGILPGHHVAVGEYVNYSFEMTIMRCVSWHESGWHSKDCKVKNILPDSKQLQCECEHLSSFAGFAGVPINTVNPFEDYKLLIHVLENPFVAVFVVCLLIVYFVLLFYTVKKDRRDQYKQCAIYLQDNLPYDKYPYLVCVYTGARLFAGTTSNVGIVVEGENTISRPHILRSTIFKALERSDDSWFIMFTPFYLGEVKLLHIWIDYSGRRPEWYCNKVVIIDLITKKDYTFLINSWFSIRWHDYVERFVKNESLENRYHQDLASDNLIYGFRETHLWASVVSKHPRSGVKSSQRLSLAFCGLFVALLVSCMFYKVLDEQPEDYPYYSIQEKEIIISVYSMIISAFLTNLVTSVFRKQVVIFDDDDEGKEKENKLNVKKSSKKNALKANLKLGKGEGIFVRLTRAILKIVVSKKKFVPVHLEVDVLQKTKKRTLITICFETFGWAICIFVIVVCAYLVILYGLKFGKIKSLEWLSSNVMSLGEEVFVASPFKIITLAVLSGILLSKIYEDIKYDIDLNVILKYKKNLLKANQELLNILVDLRKKSMYVPINFKDLSRKQDKQQKKDAVWLLLDVFIIGLLCVMMIVQSSTLCTSKYYWNNLQLQYLVKKVYKEEGFQLHEIKNVTNYLPYLAKVILPLIYQLKWYNGLPISSDFNSSESLQTFAFSSTSTLFGLPRIRQRRQKPGLCRSNSYTGLPDLCSSRLTEDTEDSDSYGEEWRAKGYDLFVKSSFWSYVEPSETYDIVSFGYSHLTYGGGGYIADLGLSQAVSEDVIFYLNNEKWLDKLTSVVFFEMTLYNPYTRTLSMLIAVTERLYLGMLMNRIYVYTIDQDYEYPAIDFILIVSLSTFIIRVILVFNRRGIENSVVNFWNIFDLAIVCLSIYCVYLYIHNIKTMRDYLEAYKDRDNEEYFHLLHLVTDLTNIQVCMMVLVIMMACRFMKSFRFGNTFEIFFYTVLSAWHTLLWMFAIIMVMVIIYWTAICFLLNNFVLSRTFLIILHKLDFKHTVKNCVQINCKVILFILSVIADISTFLIITHYLHVYKATKHKRKEDDVLNLCKVLCKRKSKTFYTNRRSNLPM